MSIVSLTRGNRAPAQLQIERMFDDFFGGFEDLAPYERIAEKLSGTFNPKLNIKETKSDIQITAELPGMDEKDIAVEINEDVLTISGEKKEEHEKNDGHWHRIETSFGKFHRSIALSSKIDKTKAVADYKKGVLKIKLPKAKEEEQMKKVIAINAD